jgi:hypothetical protein
MKTLAAGAKICIIHQYYKGVTTFYPPKHDGWVMSSSQHFFRYWQKPKILMSTSRSFLNWFFWLHITLGHLKNILRIIWFCVKKMTTLPHLTVLKSWETLLIGGGRGDERSGEREQPRDSAPAHPMRTAVCAHGAQINFGDLVPYLTYYVVGGGRGDERPG